jgi:hypothetical protein
LKERVHFAKLLWSMRHQQCLHLFYFVTGLDGFLVCAHSFHNIFGLFVRKWETLLKECRVDYFCGPIVHGNLGNKSCHNSLLSFLLEPKVMAFLETLSDEKVFFFVFIFVAFYNSFSNCFFFIVGRGRLCYMIHP